MCDLAQLCDITGLWLLSTPPLGPSAVFVRVSDEWHKKDDQWPRTYSERKERIFGGVQASFS